MLLFLMLEDQLSIALLAKASSITLSRVDHLLYSSPAGQVCSYSELVDHQPDQT